jgi:hypothetical protein
MRLCLVVLGSVLSVCSIGGLLGCTNTEVPTPTEAVCADPDTNPLTWDSFGQKFMADYCTHCHSSALVRSKRNGAPLFHDYDTLAGVLKIPDHIDEQAGSGPAATNTSMPPDRCPSSPGGPVDRDCAKPSKDERAKLAEWLACELLRPHTVR